LGAGKIALQPPKHRQRRVVGIDTKENLVVWIVLAAKAREVLIGFRVKAEDWLDIADGGQELGRLEPGQTKIPKTAEDRDAIVDERNCGYREKHGPDCGPGQQDNTSISIRPAYGFRDEQIFRAR
jgi:hypothetical protein